MTSTTPCTIPDLAVFLPYHVGFRLTGSMVIVGLDGDRLDLVERVDLPADGLVLTDSTTARLVLALARRRPSTVVVYAYADGRFVGPACVAVTRAIRCVTPDVRSVVVRSGRWREGDAPWRRLPDPGEVPLVAEYVGRGISPLSGRDSLLSALAPGPRRPSTGRVAEQGRRGHTDGLAAWSRLVRAAPWDDDEDDLVTVLAFLTDVGNRDALLGRLAPLTAGDADGEDAGAGGCGALDLVERRAVTRAALVRLVRAAPDPLRPVALSVLAVWAWSCGDGATAAIAAEAALQHDPSYSLARIITSLLQGDVRPPVVTER